MMHQTLDLKPSSELEQTGSHFPQEEPIFGPNFKVEDMSNPQRYIPSYGPGQGQYLEPSCVESCNSCMGWCCIYSCAYPFALCCCKCGCAYELGTGKAGIVSQFGKFSRLINPGLSMINPCSEEVHEVYMGIQFVTPTVIQCITKDNVKISITASLAYRVVNPVMVYYVLGSQMAYALGESTHSSIRNTVGQHNLDQVLVGRVKTVSMALEMIKANMPPGIAVENLFLEDIIVPPGTLQDLSAVAKQKRISEAIIINSKADVQSASLLKEAAQLLDTKAAMQIRYLEMVENLGKRGAKLIMPIGINKKGFKQ